MATITCFSLVKPQSWSQADNKTKNAIRFLITLGNFIPHILFLNPISLCCDVCTGTSHEGQTGWGDGKQQELKMLRVHPCSLPESKHITVHSVLSLIKFSLLVYVASRLFYLKLIFVASE